MGRATLRLALLGALAAACSGPPVMPDMCTGTGGFLDAQNDAFRVAGDNLSVQLRHPMMCPTSIEVRATVSVLGPDNLPLPLLEGEATRVLSAQERVPNQGVFTTVKVHAAVPGAYHFSARFEPNLGLAQRDIFVAENHRDAGPVAVVPGGGGLSSCQHIDLAENGQPLCLRGQVRLFDLDGGVQQALSVSGVAARVGPVLWVAESTSLSRWVPGDGGLVREPAGTFFRDGEAMLAADEHGVLLPNNQGGLTHVSFLDGGLVGSTWSLSEFATTLGLWKSGVEYLKLGGSGQQVLCSGRLHDAGTCSPLNNFGSPESPVASEAAGLWTTSDDINRFPPVKTLILRNGGTLRELVLPPGWSPADAGLSAWDTGAVLYDEGRQPMLVIDRRGQFTLQKFPALTLVGVTGSYVVMRDGAGRVVVFAR